VNFSCQFLASAKEGDWLEARVSFNKIGRKLVFGDCKIFNGDTMVFASEGVFSVQIKESK
jgi:acyl-coenzyme A thioesterase PaaI-like protein